MSRIILFANGVMTKPELLKSRLQADDTIFCVDGGTRHALSLGLKPDAIIGDLDSVSPDIVAQMEAKGVTVHRYPRRKDETDLELALRLALEQQPDEVLLVTALGGRIDQMLANVLLLTRPEYAQVRLILVDGPQVAILLRPHQSVAIQGRPGDILSLIPLTPRVHNVNLAGVEWPLENAMLSLGSTWSISNVLEGSQATVQIGEGIVLVVHLETMYEEELTQ